MQTIEEFFSSEVTTLVSDAPDWKLERSHTLTTTSAGAGITQSAITAPTGSSLVPGLSPSPITPASNNTWSPHSVEDAGPTAKKSGVVVSTLLTMLTLTSLIGGLIQ